MFMAANSISMLRQHNKTIAIKVIFVEGDCISHPEWGFSLSKEDFLRHCDEHNAQIEYYPRHPNEFFLLNKTYITKIQSPNLLFLDVDTFVFDDVQKIFDAYKHDVVACKNHWVSNWQDLFPIMPMNSGVLLFNNSWHFDKYDKWAELCSFYKSEPWGQINNGHCREEFALTKLASESDHCYFDKSHVHNPLYEQDLVGGRNSIIFHSYTQNWKAMYRGFRSKKTFSRRLV